MKNALTIDLEEWFHICGLERRIPRSEWPLQEHRARRATLRLLDLLGETKGTFFVLGYVADRDPELVRIIARAGHEIGSHGWGHGEVTRMTPEEFRSDLRRSVDSIGSACGIRPLGYRAPGWTIRRENLWALDVLREEGFQYDSSFLPWYPGLRPEPHPVRGLWEFPLSTRSLFGIRVPVLNGTAVRLLPGATLSAEVRRLNSMDLPAILAIHPWEVDPGFPRIHSPLVSGWLHSCNVRLTAPRLRRLTLEAEYVPVRELLHPLLETPVGSPGGIVADKDDISGRVGDDSACAASRTR